MKHREQAHLVVMEKTPMMRTVDLSGEFTDQPLSAGQASKWLRELLLRAGASAAEVEGVSSHSLKATPLSWTAKFGLDQYVRKVLGYHVVAGSSSMLHYSRDEQAEPLRQFESMMQEIRNQTFDPDATRSGYKKRATSSMSGPVRGPEEAAEPEVPVEVLPVEDSSSSDDSSSSESEFDDEAVLGPMTKQRPPSKFGSEVFFKHVRLWTLHRSHATEGSKLACGRFKHNAYVEVDGEPSVELPRCMQCFGSQVEDAALE